MNQIFIMETNELHPYFTVRSTDARNGTDNSISPQLTSREDAEKFAKRYAGLNAIELRDTRVCVKALGGDDFHACNVTLDHIRQALGRRVDAEEKHRGAYGCHAYVVVRLSERERHQIAANFEVF